MAKKSAKQNSETREVVLKAAIDSLTNELGYASIDREEIEGEPCAIAKVGSRPAVLVFVPEKLTAIGAVDEEIAIQLGAVVSDGPADYVWATVTGKVGEGFIYSWLPEHECQVSELPRAESFKKK